jgi:hypothetical protein
MKALATLLVAALITGATLLLPSHTLRAMSMGQSTEQVTSTDLEYSDCEMKVKGTYNGVEFDLTITISDVSGFECIRLKVALLAAVF